MSTMHCQTEDSVAMVDVDVAMVETRRGGRSGGYGGNGGRCRGGPPPNVGRGYSGQPNSNRDKPFCTHCGRYRHTCENCWDLHGRPGNVSAAPAEAKHPNGSNEQELNFKVDSQNWKDELLLLRQRLEALEGVTQDAYVGMASFSIILLLLPLLLLPLLG
eukprot:TRINITY_DN30740_c0_g2_i2.p1 TRINITY_DN30740_c0_g2~~TRINITY_DN30740_c0_g2_i2.p1  ORF type:complete len:160 (+),score=29.43 TRINITY_DN30740_c0_g2_i2:785-1264(+)